MRWNDLDYSIEKTGDWQLFLCLSNNLLFHDAFLTCQASRGGSHMEVRRNSYTNRKPKEKGR